MYSREARKRHMSKMLEDRKKSMELLIPSTKDLVFLENLERQLKELGFNAFGGRKILDTILKNHIDVSKLSFGNSSFDEFKKDVESGKYDEYDFTDDELILTDEERREMFDSASRGKSQLRSTYPQDLNRFE